MAMKKKKKTTNNIGVENLKGFFRQGASTRSPGNIPTGHFELDFVIHHGIVPKNVDLNEIDGYDPKKPLGVPLGKLVELFGEEGSGKSSIAYRVCGYAQKMGYKCCWIDAENSFSEDLAEVNGANKDEFIFSDLVNDEDPDVVYCAEDIFNGIIAIIKKEGKPSNQARKKNDKRLGVIVLDSVANLIPKAKMEASAEDQSPAVVARLLSNELKKVVNYAAKYGVAVIFINQLREKVGVMFGNPETTPGGKALKFNASLRIRVGKSLKDDNDIYQDNEHGEKVLMGRKSTVSLAKNRFAKPYKGDPIQIKIWYEQCFPNLDDIIFKEARKLKILKPKKGVISWDDEGISIEGDGDTFMKGLKMKGLTTKLILQVIALAKTNGVILPPELMQLIGLKVSLGELPSDALEDDNVQETEEESKDVGEDVAALVAEEPDNESDDEEDDDEDEEESNDEELDEDDEDVLEEDSNDDDGNDEEVEKPAGRKRKAKAS
jgi:RecA/RadA recombinase